MRKRRAAAGRVRVRLALAGLLAGARASLLASLLAGVLAGVSAGACAPPRASAPAPARSGRGAAEAQAVADQLLAADRAFAAATAARGLDGWMSFFAPEAVALQRLANPVRGTAAIRARDSVSFANPDVRLRWAPTDAGAFADGRTGWTVGRYELRRRGEDGTETVAGTGRYITLWRRAPDGGWLVTLDTGAPDR